MEIKPLYRTERQLWKRYLQTSGKLCLICFIFWGFLRIFFLDYFSVVEQYLAIKSFLVVWSGFTFMYYAEYLADYKRLAWSKNLRRLLLLIAMTFLILLAFLLDRLFLGVWNFGIKNISFQLALIFSFHAIFCYIRDA